MQCTPGPPAGRAGSIARVADDPADDRRDDLDVGAMVERFRARARAVRQRPIPPVEGPERKRFVDQAKVDFMDYAMIGDAAATLDDGILTLRIDLRPRG